MQRIAALALLSPFVLLVASCASPPPPPATVGTAVITSCEVSVVPGGAVFGARPGMDIATWPPATPTGRGCQRVWYGQRSHPEAMQVLATYYFDEGRVYRLVGRVPGGAEYECHYRAGELEGATSRNVEHCPKATELHPGM